MSKTTNSTLKLSTVMLQVTRLVSTNHSVGSEVTPLAIKFFDSLTRGANLI